MTQSSSFSNAFKLAVLQQNTAEVILWLLTIEHPESGTTHRLVNNLDNVTSRGNVYQAFPFQFVLPDDDGNTLPEISIAVQDVSRELIDTLRQYANGLQITAEIILASAPDNVEFAITDLVVRNVQYGAQSVSLTAQVEDLLNQRFPADSFLPRSFAGMFK